jgi:hypothetical protein
LSSPEECVRHPDELGIRHRQVFDLLCIEKEIIFCKKERFFSFFQLNYHFLVKRTPEEESGMIHPEGGMGVALTIKKI